MAGPEDMSLAELQAWLQSKQANRSWRPNERDFAVLEHVWGLLGDLQTSAHAPSPAGTASSRVRTGAAFAKLTEPSATPASFGTETYDALLKYSEAVASGYLGSKFAPQAFPVEGAPSPAGDVSAD